MIQIQKYKMDEELIFVCHIESDGFDEKLENEKRSESRNVILEGPEKLTVPFDGLKMKDEKNGDKRLEYESLDMANGYAQYGSSCSLVSIGGLNQRDEKGLRIIARRRKKASVCSNFSTFSSSSGQPYIAMMSNASRERKVSSLSAGSFSKAGQDSVKPRKTSEVIPPAISIISNDYVDDKTEDQIWTGQKYLFGNKKKISLKRNHGRYNTGRGVEIFPGYEKYIQERINFSEDKPNDKIEEKLLTCAERKVCK